MVHSTSGANLYLPGVWFADAMTSFSGVTIVLFCFVFVFMLKFAKAAALRSIVIRYAGAPIATRVSFLISFCLFGDVAFSELFCTFAAFSLYGEYVVRFPLPNGVFLPCDHGLDFLHQLIL